MWNSGQRTQQVGLGEIFTMLIWCMLVEGFGFRGLLDMSYEFRKGDKDCQD